jgi:hypothetical protein
MPWVSGTKAGDGNLATVDKAIDFGNGALLTALNAVTNLQTQLNKYNQLLSDVDDALNKLEKSEKNVTDLGSRLLAGVKVKFGPDSLEYEKAGGTRASEIKRSPRTKTTATKYPHQKYKRDGESCRVLF